VVKKDKGFKVIGLGLAILVGLICTLGIILFIINPDICYVMNYKIHNQKTMERESYVMPQTKKITKPILKEENFIDFMRFNLKFTLPFDKSNISVVKDIGDTFIANCGNDIIVMIRDDRSSNEMVTKGLIEDKPNLKKYQKLVGVKPLESDFEFTKFLLEKRSKKIDFYSTKKDIAINELASVYGEILFSKNTDIIYNSEIKGFESSSKDSIRKEFSLSIYDNRKNNYLIFVAGNNATQEEVDYILSSIQSLN